VQVKITLEQACSGNYTVQKGLSSQRSPFVLGNSFIKQGQGKAIVLAVGKQSQYGMVKQSIALSKVERSFLHGQLERYTNKISKVGIWASLFIFLTLLFWLLYSVILENDLYSFNVHMSEVINYIVFCIALLVVTTPSGLKIAETIALSSAIRQFTKNNTEGLNINQIKNTFSLFRMAECTDIFLPKSGGVTTDQQSVSEVYMGDMSDKSGNSTFVASEQPKHRIHFNGSGLLSPDMTELLEH
jgi:magnesium-transporting ATPase (P-type)